MCIHIYANALASLQRPRCKSQEEPILHFQSKGKKKPVSQFKGHQAERILSFWEESKPFW